MEPTIDNEGKQNPSPTALTSEEIVAALNELIEYNLDGKAAYELAADDAESELHREMFQEHAAQRAKFAEEMSDLVRRYGGEATQAGHLAGTFHRAWMNIRAAVSNGDHAIMEECATGEATALQAYQSVLVQDIPEDVRDMIRHHMSYIRIAHDKVEALARLVD